MTNAGNGLKIVFCGTPQFAVPTLEALLAAGHRNRARRLAARPARRAATSSSPPRPSSRPRLPPASPSRSPKRSAATRSFARSLNPSPPTPLSSWPTAASFRRGCSRCPRLGCINLHASLLPKYRGAAPIQWAVAMGDAYTGNTTMLLEEGLDTGPILLQQTMEIGPEQTAVDLFPLLAHAGAPLVVETLAGLANGTIQPSAAEPRSRNLRAAARSRRRPYRLCRAHCARNSTIAGADFNPGPALSPLSTARS